MYQLRSQMNPVQNNQDISINTYVKVYDQVQGQPIPEQMQYQQQNEKKVKIYMIILQIKIYMELLFKMVIIPF